MTASNHAITGAVVALVVGNPLLAIPAAFLAHFAMDVIPHFGISEKDVLARNASRQFRRTLIADCILAGLLLAAVPILLSHQLDWRLTFACMFACMSPDLVWGYHFFYETKHGLIKKKKLFSIIHKNIQWSETPKGAMVEIIWFFGALTLLALISSS